MNAERDELHLCWSPGLGLHLRLGDRPGRQITVERLRVHIEAARFVHGDREADRLESELAAQLAKRDEYERAEGSADSLDAADSK